MTASSRAAVDPVTLAEDGFTDDVDMVDPDIISARGRWFFFGTDKD